MAGQRRSAVHRGRSWRSPRESEDPVKDKNITISRRGLQIHIPATLCHIVGVADAVSELWAAATDFTFFGHKTRISSELQSHSVAGRFCGCHASSEVRGRFRLPVRRRRSPLIGSRLLRLERAYRGVDALLPARIGCDLQGSESREFLCDIDGCGGFAEGSEGGDHGCGAIGRCAARRLIG